MLTIRHTRATDPQRRFWSSQARFRAFVGGIGSGKTRAGVVECLRQPANTLGMVLAPTFPMLRDSTLQTFLELTDKAGVLVDFNKTNMTARLVGNRTVLFRQAGDADRLRGPNLSWIYIDEAAMVDYQVFLVLLGRLRVEPRRLWLTTSPLGKDSWIYREFGEPGEGRELIRASTETNHFLPDGFVDSLKTAYDADFARQEIDGDWIENAYGVLIPSSWIERAATLERPRGNPGRRIMGVDGSAGTGRDRSAFCILDRCGILHMEASNRCDVANTALRIKQLSQQFGVSQSDIVFDASAGGGGDQLPRHLQPYGITATRYYGSQSGGDRFVNLRSAMGHRLRSLLDPSLPMPFRYVQPDPFSVKPGPIVQNTLQPPFVFPPANLNGLLGPLTREVGALRFLDRQGKFALENKDAMKDRLGHSPDLIDSLFIALSRLPMDC